MSPWKPFSLKPAERKKVRKWMKTASNYYFELAKYNCSDGGYIKDKNGRRITYDDPVINETNGVNNCKKN